MLDFFYSFIFFWWRYLKDIGLRVRGIVSYLTHSSTEALADTILTQGKPPCDRPWQSLKSSIDRWKLEKSSPNISTTSPACWESMNGPWELGKPFTNIGAISFSSGDSRLLYFERGGVHQSSLHQEDELWYKCNVDDCQFRTQFGDEVVDSNVDWWRSW